MQGFDAIAISIVFFFLLYIAILALLMPIFVYRIRNEIINLDFNVVNILNFLKDYKKEKPNQDNIPQTDKPPPSVNLVLDKENKTMCPKCKRWLKLNPKTIESKFLKCPACNSEMYFSITYK